MGVSRKYVGQEEGSRAASVATIDANCPDSHAPHTTTSPQGNTSSSQHPIHHHSAPSPAAPHLPIWGMTLNE